MSFNKQVWYLLGGSLY